MSDWIFSVTDVNLYVQRALKMDSLLQNIRVRGEISNCKTYASGHTYFSLKDEESVIPCAWFANARMKSSFRPEDGLKVIARGNIGLYLKGGQYQMTITDMSMDGVGAWYERYKRLEARFEAEGLFAPERKKKIPEHVETIGVVTSGSGAVFHDICRVASRRQPGIRILLYPVAVQGGEAPGEIAEGIRWFSEHFAADVLIAGRGGGSIEDLWCFNEEEVVRAIAECAIPVISAVGHETDNTLADRAADLRAGTPSMAAELAVPDSRVLTERLKRSRKTLCDAITHFFEEREEHLDTLERILTGMSPMNRLLEYERRGNDLALRLNRAAENRMNVTEARLNREKAVLTALDPHRVLERGYALVLDELGHVVTGAASPGEILTVDTRTARMKVRVLEAENKE